MDRHKVLCVFTITQLKRGVVSFFNHLKVGARIQEVSQAAQNLSEMARSLQSLVLRFKLEHTIEQEKSTGLAAETDPDNHQPKRVSCVNQPLVSSFV